MLFSLNNEKTAQDYRIIKWRIMQDFGFKELESAKRTISGIEIVIMLKKDQLLNSNSSTDKSSIS